MKRCEVKENAKWNLEYFFKNTEEYKNSIVPIGKVKINTEIKNLKRLSESGLVKIEEIKNGR